MKLERIEAIPLRIPLNRVFGGSQYSVDSRCAVVTRIHAGGLVGEVYNGDNRAHGREIARIVAEELWPMIADGDPFAVERHWQRMFEAAHPVRDRKLVMEAIACVDCALWDLIGKALGASVSRLLGGFRDSLPIISIGGYYEHGKTLDDIGREIAALKDAGMAGCKFKVGGLSPEEDAERVRAARAAAGPGFVLAVDANCGWTARDAIRFARLVEPEDIAWFEEPCLWYDDVAMMAEVRANIPIPVTAGQSEITAFAVRRLLDAKAVDLVNFDASEGGGVTEWRRAAAACALAGVHMAHHEEPQIALHLLTAVPHGTYVECFADPDRDPIWQSIWLNRPRPADGMVTLPDRPGFGIELDPAMVERYREDR